MMNSAVVLSLLFYLFTVVNSKVPDGDLHAWKFVKRTNGLCYLERYLISVAHGTEKKEPLKNYVPRGSVQIDCYKGHTVHTMNLIFLGYGEGYRLAICFFLPEENQRFICKYTDGKEITPFAEKTCNNPKLEKNDFKFFGIAYYPKKDYPKEAGYACFYSGISDDDTCEYDNANNANIGRDGYWFNQYDANKEHWVYINNSYHYSVFKGYYIGNSEKNMLNFYGDYRYVGNDYDFVHIDHSYVNFKNRYSFVGYKCYEKHYTKFFESQNVESMRSYKYPVYAYYRIIAGCGMNVEWDMTAQKGYLRTCIVINDTYDYNYDVIGETGLKLICHLVTYSDTRDIDVNYEFDKCYDHLKNNKIINVIIGGLKDESSTMKAIYIETDSKLCKYDPETKSDELLEREKYTFGYDPYNNTKIQRDESGKLFGLDIDAPERAPIFSCGINTFVKKSDYEWIVIKPIVVERNGKVLMEYKVEKKNNWDYTFVIEESTSLALDI